MLPDTQDRVEARSGSQLLCLGLLVIPPEGQVSQEASLVVPSRLLLAPGSQHSAVPT